MKCFIGGYLKLTWGCVLGGDKSCTVILFTSCGVALEVHLSLTR